MLTSALVVTDAARGFEPETIELADLAPGEVLVRVAGTGVCPRDLEPLDSPLAFERPMVLGHEGAGVVEAVGAEVVSVAAGDRVVLTYSSCGDCPSCLASRPAYCSRFVRLNFLGGRPDGSPTHHRTDGSPLFGSWFGQSSFASHALTRERNVVVVGDRRQDLAELGPFGCAFQTGAGTVLNTLGPTPGRSLVVFGCGAIGLSAVLTARWIGWDPVIAVDPIDLRLEAAAACGATHAVGWTDGDAARQVRKIARRGVDHAIDTTRSGANDALACVAEGGEAVILAAGREPLAVDGQMLLRGRGLRGAIGGDAYPPDFVPRLLDLDARGEVAFRRLIRCYPWEAANDAVADMQAGRTVKPVILPPA